MPIRVITLEREYGSGGGEIAERVATRLGWKLWDQLLTEEIARRLDCDCRAVEDHEERKRSGLLPTAQGLHAREF